MQDLLGLEDIWVQDIERGNAVRLTTLQSAYSPVWSPDGKYVVFASASKGSGSTNAGIFRIRADGSGDPQRLSEAFGFPSSISPDGKRLVAEGGNPFSAMDVWTMLIDGPSVNLKAGAVSARARVSPTGVFARWPLAGMRVARDRDRGGLCGDLPALR